MDAEFSLAEVPGPSSTPLPWEVLEGLGVTSTKEPSLNRAPDGQGCATERDRSSAYSRVLYFGLAQRGHYSPVMHIDDHMGVARLHRQNHNAVFELADSDNGGIAGHDHSRMVFISEAVA